MAPIYYCTQNNNSCPLKNSCTRYLEMDGNDNTTLFKVSCTKDNNYILYIKSEKTIKPQNNNKENNINGQSTTT